MTSRTATAGSRCRVGGSAGVFHGRPGKAHAGIGSGVTLIALVRGHFGRAAVRSRRRTRRDMLAREHFSAAAVLVAEPAVIQCGGGRHGMPRCRS